MRAEFSEMQYAYGATRELEFGTWLFPPLGIPYLPSQRKEVELGYDVAFKGLYAPVFIQYKVPDKLTRNYAKEWRLFYGPYFRFMIYPETVSPQHNILINLSKNQQFVFYLAPAFISYAEYYKYFNSRSITEESIFVPCNLLPRAYEEYHHIVYSNVSRGFYWCSEAEPITGVLGIKDMIAYCREQPKKFTDLKYLIKHLEIQLDVQNREILPSINDSDLANRLVQLQYASLYQTGASLGILRLKDIE